MYHETEVRGQNIPKPKKLANEPRRDTPLSASAMGSRHRTESPKPTPADINAANEVAILYLRDQAISVAKDAAMLELREGFIRLMSDLGIRVEMSQLKLLAEHKTFTAVADKLGEVTTTVTEDQSFPIQVFLCHSSGDKPAVRDLSKRLTADGFSPWLDEGRLLPGQEWDSEIRKAVRSSDVAIVCLSRGAITKEGYVQREIRHALDAAEEKPPGTIFVVPLKFEECDVPDRLRQWQWVALFEANGYSKLTQGLRARQHALTRPHESAQSRKDAFLAAVEKLWER